MAGCGCINCGRALSYFFDESDLPVDESEEEEDEDDDEEDEESLEEDEESLEEDEESLEEDELLPFSFLLDSEDFSLLSFLDSPDSEVEDGREAP